MKLVWPFQPNWLNLLAELQSEMFRTLNGIVKRNKMILTQVCVVLSTPCACLFYEGWTSWAGRGSVGWAAPNMAVLRAGFLAVAWQQPACTHTYRQEQEVMNSLIKWKHFSETWYFKTENQTCPDTDKHLWLTKSTSLSGGPVVSQFYMPLWWTSSQSILHASLVDQ